MFQLNTLTQEHRSMVESTAERGPLRSLSGQCWLHIGILLVQNSERHQGLPHSLGTRLRGYFVQNRTELQLGFFRDAASNA